MAEKDGLVSSRMRMKRREVKKTSMKKRKHGGKEKS